MLPTLAYLSHSLFGTVPLPVHYTQGYAAPACYLWNTHNTPAIFTTTSIPSPDCAARTLAEMAFDLSKSNETILSLAIHIVLAATDIPADYCSALERKVDLVAATRQSAEEVIRVKDATAIQYDKIQPYTVWMTVRRTLVTWELAFQAREGSNDSTKARIPRKSRSALQHVATSFDILNLPTDQLDFLFLLSYVGIEPMSIERFTELYSKCSEGCGTGAKIRATIDRYLRKDPRLARLSLEKSPKKRGLEELGNDSCPTSKKARSTPESIYTSDETSMYNPSLQCDTSLNITGESSNEMINPTWQTDIITDVPHQYDYGSLYAFQANTIPTSCPTSTWIVPTIQISDPFVDVPRPPPQPSDHAITQNTINIGTMFGTEKDQINSFLQVNTAVNLYARRLPNSTEVWVLCHFTQTTDRDSIYTLFPFAAGVLSIAEMQHFQPYTLTWTVWDSYDNFVNTTFKSLNQRHFRTIPSSRYAQLPDKHQFFDGVWNISTHPAHQDIMAEIRVRTWTPNLQAIASAFTRGIPSQLSQQQQKSWFENIGMNGDGEDAEDVE
ncbi:hypothetical protein TUN199_10479 [Pyrenophora tritici-repentis]|nr:hypothetical protein TUN205_11032 [Pyrenophora tritici-repentis]KAI0617526.1 hypothetical protein TUN199_10479 [Pyrenophora tritici-repentis]